MLAGMRNVAWGTAMAMAGILAVALADCVWIMRFWSNAFFGTPGLFHFDPQISSHGILGNAESLVGLAVVTWLVARVIRRASRSQHPPPRAAVSSDI